jgi:hypothetical protein
MLTQGGDFCSGFLVRLVLRRIVSASRKGMTAENTERSAKDAADDTILVDRLDGVLTARGLIAAIGAEQR